MSEKDFFVAYIKKRAEKLIDDQEARKGNVWHGREITLSIQNMKTVGDWLYKCQSYRNLHV